LQLNYGHSSGGADDITGTIYDGALATGHSTTTAVITQSGVTNDDYNGMLVALFYPLVDTGFPGLIAIRTITDTAVSGSAVTITWAGALTVPTSTKWTVRVAGHAVVVRLDPDWSQYLQLEPGSEIQVHDLKAEYHDVIGSEAVA